jgi:hypothetical protein
VIFNAFKECRVCTLAICCRLCNVGVCLIDEAVEVGNLLCELVALWNEDVFDEGLCVSDVALSLIDEVCECANFSVVCLCALIVLFFSTL